MCAGMDWSTWTFSGSTYMLGKQIQFMNWIHYKLVWCGFSYHDQYSMLQAPNNFFSNKLNAAEAYIDR